MFTFVTFCKDTNKIELTKKKIPDQPGNPRRRATSPRESQEPEPTPAARWHSKWLQGGSKAGAWREHGGIWTIFLRRSGGAAAAEPREKGKSVKGKG